MRPALFLMAFAGAALAQEQEIQRAVIERDQRTVEFAARLQGAPPVELQRLEELAARQLREVRSHPAPALRPYERQAAARENEAYVLRFSPPVVRAEALEALRRLIEPTREKPDNN